MLCERYIVRFDSFLCVSTYMWIFTLHFNYVTLLYILYPAISCNVIFKLIALCTSSGLLKETVLLQDFLLNSLTFWTLTIVCIWHTTGIRRRDRSPSSGLLVPNQMLLPETSDTLEGADAYLMFSEIRLAVFSKLLLKYEPFTNSTVRI
jgi:hypothetical protein